MSSFRSKGVYISALEYIYFAKQFSKSTCYELTSVALCKMNKNHVASVYKTLTGIIFGMHFFAPVPVEGEPVLGRSTCAALLQRLLCGSKRICRTRAIDYLQTRLTRGLTQPSTRTHKPTTVCMRHTHTRYNGPSKLDRIVQRKKCNYKVLVAQLRHTFVITFLAQPPGERALILEEYYLPLYHARPAKKKKKGYTAFTYYSTFI